MSSTIDSYCAGCHNGRMRSPSGFLLDQFDAARISASPDAWSRAYRQLQPGAMPPVGSRRPDRARVDAVLASIERALGADAPPPPAASSQEIATRLASMLWNSEPDAAMREETQRNRLTDPAAIERQVQRMLADDRAHAFVSRFFFPWLELDKLGDADPDKKYFPEYDVSLRDALAMETELFLLSQLREDRDPLDLWSADYTFLNGRLANHYGVPNVTGSQFHRVPASTPARRGLLGHGSILVATSRHQHGVDAPYTTPATRAKWIRLNFDPIGRWRTHDQAGPVDVSGAFGDGTSTNGVVELRQVLLQYPGACRTTITEKLLVYASTGSVARSIGTPETLTRARRMLRSSLKPRWSALIAAVVQGR